MSTALLYAVVFVGGVLTIVSPCILPVLPFVFARTGRRFRTDTLPMLIGIAFSFALVATAAAVGAQWAASAANAGRWVALSVLLAAGVALLLPRVAALVTAPLVRVGASITRATTLRMSQASQSTSRSTSRSASHSHAGANADVNVAERASPNPFGALAVGLATGLLWAPCAGPILGLVFAAAIAGQDPTGAAMLFGMFALGASVSLAVVLFAGAKVLEALRDHLHAEVWVRRGMGITAIAAVGIIALGLDAKFFAGGGLVQTASAEELLIKTFVPDVQGAPGVVPAVLTQPKREPMPEPKPVPKPVPTPDLGPFPGFAGGTAWIGSPPLTAESLRGKVVFVDIWTFECYNCLNALPSVKALHATYASKGLQVIGVHTPELPRERVHGNVVEAVKKLGVTYPVVTDNAFVIWTAFHNRYWPAAYIVDKQGRIRYHWDGEGHYDEQERVVQQLLAEPDLRVGSH